MASDIQMPSGPRWPDLLRYAQGSRLRIELALAPALRDALAVASAEARRWFAAIDGAVLQVERLGEAACELRCQGHHGGGEFSAVPSDCGGYRVRGCLRASDALRMFDFPRMIIQTGGTLDAYLAQPAGGQWQQLLRLSYARGAADGSAEIWVYAATCTEPSWPEAVRALLPAQLLFARLVPLLH